MDARDGSTSDGPACSGDQDMNSRSRNHGSGIMVTHNPLHRSGRADFPHPALASGNDAKPPQWIRVVDLNGRQVVGYEPPHPVPENPAILAAPRQHAVPEPAHLEAEHVQRRTVHGHPVIADVPSDNRSQPLAYLGDRVVHAPLELGLYLAQLRLQTLADRLPYHGKPPITPLLPADMREAEKVERLGLPLSTPLPVCGRERSIVGAILEMMSKPCNPGEGA